MKLNIIADSSTDLPEKYLKKISLAPMTLKFKQEVYKDRINLSPQEFYKKLKSINYSPGSAAPSPGDFLNLIKKDHDNFIVAISSALSSSYNNAVLAKDMFLKKVSESFVHVFDTLNASVGEGLIILKLIELREKSMDNNTVINELGSYIEDLNTFFVLENMNNLINSGRVNKIVGKLVNLLNIKLLMGRDSKGAIKTYEKIRGSKKAFYKLIDYIEKYGSDFENKYLGIAHYDCYEKALKFKKEVEKRFNFKEIIITEMGPTIATYADRDAILISF
ncbi:MAG: DegV family protein [Halanaerobiales bacterium]|nr:DegV family protein [Halanaerobiales bacterium]